MTEPNNDSWQLSRTISISHILTTVLMVVSVMWWISGQDTRMSNAELNISHLQQGRLHYEARSEKKFDELKTDLRTINDKLDRLIREAN